MVPRFSQWITTMNTPTILLSAVGAVVAIAALAHLALPQEVVIQRSAVIEADPEAVYAVLESARGYDRINPFRADDPDLQTEYTGPERGVGSALRWSGKQGEGVQTITAIRAGERVETEIHLGPLGVSRQVFIIQPSAGGSNVTWATTMAFAPLSPGRIFGVFADRILGKKYEAGLENLALA